MHPNFEKITNKYFLDPNTERKFEDGKRLRGVKRAGTKERPLISIITVVKDNVRFIQETIDSIKSQKYDNIEYIIIDGLSEDGTLDVIKKNIDYIDYVVSEKDLGNYDAINKGLSLSTGDLIGIVNGDDILLPDTTNTLINYFNKFPDIDFLFGSVKKHWGTLSGYYPRKIRYSWFFYTSHSTGFFIKKKAAELNGKYSLKYQYSSDFDYFYRLIVHNKSKGIATKKDEVFGIFRPGGISATLDKEKHFFEKIQIRFDNKQNKLFLFLLILLKYIKNLFSKKRIKLKKFILFVIFNYFK
jgi:cellulose synthase/poly-beta-1,6-N-acetylglucosamine synthase-like glycosyltransferase